MKKVLFIRTVVLAILLFSLTSSFSQLIDSQKLASVQRNVLQGPTSVATESADQQALMRIKARSNKMFRNFTSAFADATNIKMHTEHNETQISCLVNNIVNKVGYTNRGRQLYVIRYFEETKLPERARDIVLDAYPRFSIFGFVAEVNVAEKTAYLVMIENQTSWKRVRVIGDNIDTYEEYKKP